MSGIVKSKYINKNLQPTIESEKTLRGVHFTILWFGMVLSLSAFMFAHNFIGAGFNWLYVLLFVFLGCCIVCIILTLIGSIGFKYGIPFPVVMRCSFGLEGAKFASILRAIISCGWYSVLTWNGSRCLYAICELILPGLKYFKGNVFGCDILMFFCLVIFILLQLYLACGGMKIIFKFLYITVPIVVIFVIIILFHYAKLLNYSDAFTALQDLNQKKISYNIIIIIIVSSIALWSTLTINICDFTRYAKTHKSQVIGQFIGLPFGMLIVVFVGIFFSGCCLVALGEYIWDPIILLKYFIKDPVIYFLGYFVLLLGILTSNMAANVVPMANALSNLAPKILSFRVAAFLSCLLSLLFLPLNLISNPESFVFVWLIGYCSITGAFSGIIISDYYLLRKKYIKVASLYKVEGEYYYKKGWNLIAIAVLFIAILPSLPGFLKNTIDFQILGKFNIFFESIYNYSWLVSFTLSLTLYYLFMKLYYNKKK